MSDQPLSIPDYLLEQYALGELSPGETDTLTRRLGQDPALRERLIILRASNEEILAAHPAEEFALAVERRLRDHERPRRMARPHRSPAVRWMVVTPAIAAVALVTVLLVKQEQIPLFNHGLSRNTAARESTRAKGRPQLRIYRQSGAGVDTLRDNDPAARGDVLQLSYVSFGRPYGAILSIDGRGAVILHFPPTPDQSTRLDPRGETLLPQAYELDDAPDFERFYLVTSTAPVDLQAVLAAARQVARSGVANRTATLPLPDRLGQSSFLIRKRGSSL
jgi:hypothetical protein